MVPPAVADGRGRDDGVGAGAMARRCPPTRPGARRGQAPGRMDETGRGDREGGEGETNKVSPQRHNAGNGPRQQQQQGRRRQQTVGRDDEGDSHAPSSGRTACDRQGSGRCAQGAAIKLKGTLMQGGGGAVGGGTKAPQRIERGRKTTRMRCEIEVRDRWRHADRRRALWLGTHGRIRLYVRVQRGRHPPGKGCRGGATTGSASPPPPEGCVVGTSVRARLNWLPRTFVRRARRGRCEVCRALRPTSVLWERADGGGGCL